MGKMWGWGLGESSDDSDDAVSHILDFVDPEDGKFDDKAGIPAQLKRLFETWDVLKDHDLSALRWDVVGIDQDYGPGKRERRNKPPPPEDPRTQLPHIFGFRGWNMYGCPDFYIREDHLPCYPLDLVGRLKALHISGVGGRREDGVVYMVKTEYRESDITVPVDEVDPRERFGWPRLSPSVPESDDEEVGSEDGNGDDVLIENIGTYETLELANDAVMSAFQKHEDFAEYLRYQESSNEEEGGTPDFRLGLYKILPEGQERQLPCSGEEGATWHLDDSGCLRLKAYGGDEMTIFTVIRHKDEEVKHTKRQNQQEEKKEETDKENIEKQNGRAKIDQGKQDARAHAIKGKAPQGKRPSKKREGLVEDSEYAEASSSRVKTGTRKRTARSRDTLGSHKRPRHRK